MITFEDAFLELLEESKKYDTCMSFRVCEDSKSVELILDTAESYYSEWIEGEGSDIGLLRSQETNKVVGCRLPLKNSRLAVYHEGPLRINAGFRKSET